MACYLCTVLQRPASVCRYSVYNVHAATPLWLVLIFLLACETFVYVFEIISQLPNNSDIQSLFMSPFLQKKDRKGHISFLSSF